MNNTPYKSIINFYWNAKTKYSLHSPFVYDFFNTVLNLKIQDHQIDQIENERNVLIKDNTKITFIEYGAGSKLKNGNSRKVNDIAKSSLSGPWQCRLMFNMIRRFSPKKILEVGR